MKPMSHLLLIIEDDPQLQMLLSTTLESQHYQVLALTTGQEGLIAARHKQPSLLILDLGLPDIDGQEVISRLRKWSEVPIIVLSARNQESEITQALDNGADDYLTKPFSTVILLSRIKALLRRVAKVPGGAQEFFQVRDHQQIARIVARVPLIFRRQAIPHADHLLDVHARQHLPVDV